MQIDEAKTQEPKDRQGCSNYGDYFHNGVDVLNDVVQWHKVLRNNTRRSDWVTTKVLDIVDRHMLRGKASERKNALGICMMLDTIRDEMRKSQSNELPATIVRALHEWEKEASRDQAPCSTNLATEFEMKEQETMLQPGESLLGTPQMASPQKMKTTHRSEQLPSLDDSLSALCPEPEELGKRTRKSEGSIAEGDALGQHLDYIASRTQAPQSPPRQKPQLNVWQARDHIEKKGGAKNKIMLKLKRKKDLDELLSSHFGDRDLVRFFLK